MKRRVIFVSATISTATWLCLPKPPLLDGVDFSRRVFDRHGQLLRVTLTDDGKYRIFTALERVSPALVRATLAQEDRYFAEHPGVNPIASARATLNFFRGQKRGGASTITMQVARLRFHLRTHSLGGKCAQMWRALELERHYSKSQLLEAYLNLAPYGRNLEGIGAASEIYFGKEAAALSQPEAFALCVIPQNPARRALQIARPNESISAARARLFARLTTADTKTPAQFLPEAAPRAAWRAPHFCNQVLHESSAAEIRSTLDADVQRLIERRIADYIAANAARGMHNAAALLVDFSTMEVRAQVGSADFFNDAIDGQIDGTRSARSPGSTLKPFVYALALDQGLIHPLTMLKDAPRSFGGFDPENFDREFVGPIKASDALARSRNIPAVALAEQLRGPTLYQFLQRTGMRLPRSEKDYGLALPLGGAEVTMEDLVRLYAVLANGGKLQALRRCDLPNDDGGHRQLLSPEAAFLTLQMLGQMPRPGLNAILPNDGIFWKTGTSQGFRDAWTIAVFDRSVLAVWIGNFSGKGNPAFVGRRAAAPLLFQIVEALRGAGYSRPMQVAPPPNANLREVEFCAESGELPNEFCPHRIRGWFIPGVSPITRCEIHRVILIDDATGLRVAENDGTRKVRREVYEFWPSDLRALFEEAGLPRRLPPPFLPEAAHNSLGPRGGTLRIVTPRENGVYSLGGNACNHRALALQAETEASVAKVYWFADRAFLGASARGEKMLWQPNPGRYQLTAMDDAGRTDSRTVTFQTN